MAFLFGFSCVFSTCRLTSFVNSRPFTDPVVSDDLRLFVFFPRFVLVIIASDRAIIVAAAEELACLLLPSVSICEKSSALFCAECFTIV